MAEEVAAGYVSLYARMEGAQVASEISSVLESAASTAAGAFSGFGDIVSGIGKDLTIMSVGADALLTKAGKGIIDTISVGENAAITFNTMGKAMGEAEGFADSFISKLNEFAVKTPFEFTNVLPAVKQLMAMGYTANEILDDTNHGILVSAGNAAAALGLTDQGLSNILLQFGHIKSMGKAMSFQLNAMARNGLPVWDMLAEHMKMSVEEVRALVRAGDLDADTTIAALMEGMEKYEGMMDAMSRTLKGIVSNIKDSLHVPIMELRDSGGYKKFEESMAGLIDPLRDLIKSFAPVFDRLFYGLSKNVDFVGEKIRQITHWLNQTDKSALADSIKSAVVALNSGPLLLLLGKGSSAVGGFLSGFGASVSREIGIAGKAVDMFKSGIAGVREVGTLAFGTFNKDVRSAGNYVNDLRFVTESFANKGTFAFKNLGRSVKGFATDLNSAFTTGRPSRLTERLGDSVEAFGRRLNISRGQMKSWSDGVKAYLKLPNVSERFEALSKSVRSIGSVVLPAAGNSVKAFASVFAMAGKSLLSTSIVVSIVAAAVTSLMAVFNRFGFNVADAVAKAMDGFKTFVRSLHAQMASVGDMFQRLLDSEQLEALAKQLTQTLPTLLSSALNSVFSGLGSPAIGKAFVSIVGIIADTIAVNGPIILDGLLRAIGFAANGIASAIPVVAERIPEFLRGMADAIVTNAPLILDGFVRAFKNIASGIGNAMAETLKGTDFEGLGNQFKTFGESLANLADTLGKTDWTPFLELGGALANLALSIGGLVLDTITGFVEGMAQSDFSGITSLANGVKDIANGLARFASGGDGNDGAAALGAFVGTVTNGAFEGAGNILSGIGTNIKLIADYLNILKDAWEGNIDGVISGMGQAFKDLGDNLKNFVMAVPWLGQLVTILDALGVIDLSNTGSQLKVTGDALQGIAGKEHQINSEGGKLNQNLPDYTNTLKKFGDDGSQSTKKLTDEFGLLDGAVSEIDFEGITRKASGMADGMQGSMQRAVSSTSGFGSQVSTNISAASGSMSRIVSDSGVMATGVGNNFAAAGNNSQKMVPGIQSSTAKGTSAFNGFVSSIGSGAAQVGGFIGQIPGMFGSLWSIDVSGAGRAIMGGFLSGLQSMWGAITSFVGGIAAWIAAHKGPLDYDRKLLIPAGKAIMGGLYKGLQSSFKGQVMPLVTSMAGTIDQAFEGVTSPLPSNVSVSMAGMANGDVRGPVIMQPVWNLYGVNDPETFAHQSMRAMIQLANSEE